MSLLEPETVREARSGRVREIGRGEEGPHGRVRDETPEGGTWGLKKNERKNKRTRQNSWRVSLVRYMSSCQFLPYVRDDDDEVVDTSSCAAFPSSFVASSIPYVVTDGDDDNYSSLSPYDFPSSASISPTSGSFYHINVADVSVGIWLLSRYFNVVTLSHMFILARCFLMSQS